WRRAGRLRRGRPSRLRSHACGRCRRPRRARLRARRSPNSEVTGRGLGLAPLLTLLAAAPAAATMEATLQVRVVDSSRRPLPDVTATLASIDETGAAYTARAEAGGVLSFYDVGPGAYRLRVEHPGLAAATS